MLSLLLVKRIQDLICTFTYVRRIFPAKRYGSTKLLFWCPLLRNSVTAFSLTPNILITSLNLYFHHVFFCTQKHLFKIPNILYTLLPNVSHAFFIYFLDKIAFFCLIFTKSNKCREEWSFFKL